MTRTTTTREVAWSPVRTEVPWDWEVIRHGLSEAQGRLEFGTREGFMGQLSWQRVRREPDAGRMMLAFYRRQLEKTDKERARKLNTLKLRRAGDFSVAALDEGAPCVAARYVPEDRLYLQWILPNFREDIYARVWCPMLGRTETNLADPCRWVAFGLRAVLPASFELEQSVIQPANVRLLFESRARHRLSLRRWGLPRVLLEGQTLANFYHRVLQREHARVDDVRESEFRGCPAATVEFRQRGEYRMDRMVGRWWSGRGLVWLEGEEQRIYAVDQSWRRGSEPLDPAGLLFADETG